jgi:DNA-binding NarL/FixJ family response regulator
VRRGGPRGRFPVAGRIAGQLYLSVRTVDTHVDHVLTRLGFSNRSQLVAWAYESGLATGDAG